MTDAADSRTPETRRFTLLYILALSLVAVLTIAGQLLVQQSLVRLEHDSTVVNIAGRQRMLSQRLARLTLTGHHADQQSVRDKIARELSDTLLNWRESHSSLITGNVQLGLPGKNSEEIRELFSSVQPSIERISSAAMKCIALWNSPVAGTRLQMQPMVDSLVVQCDEFLAGMDAIVSQYEVEAQARVSRLRMMERGLLAATLTVLLLEGLFVFSPAVASIARGMRKMKQLAALLEQTKEAAEIANHAKTEFLTRVSHELRTPLHATLGMLELAEADATTKSMRQRLATASDCARTLRSLVDDLLDVSAIESGQPVSLREQPTDVKRMIRKTCLAMRPMAHRKKLRLHFLFSGEGNWSFSCDAFRLNQVLMNLLQNAVRYTDRGEIACECHVQPVDKLCSQLQLTIRDTGVGMTSEQQQKIFGPCEQFDKIDQHTKTHAMGRQVGLGLSIARSLVNAMQGEISVTSRPGGGSTFIVELPLRIASLDPAINDTCSGVRSIAKVSGKVTSPSAADRTVLVVDDEPANRAVMREYFKRLDWKCTTARTACSAREAVHRRPFDLIVVDRQLPDGDGIQLGNWLKQSCVNLPPLMLLTADTGVAHQPAFDGGLFASVLYKPLSLKQLAEAIESLGITRPAALIAPNICDAYERVSPCSDRTELLQQLRGIINRDLPQQLASLNQYIRSQDIQQAKLLAHRMYGAVANAGCARLAGLLRELEGKLAESLERPSEDATTKLLASFEELLIAANSEGWQVTDEPSLTV